MKICILAIGCLFFTACSGSSNNTSGVATGGAGAKESVVQKAEDAIQKGEKIVNGIENAAAQAEALDRCLKARDAGQD